MDFLFFCCYSFGALLGRPLGVSRADSPGKAARACLLLAVLAFWTAFAALMGLLSLLHFYLRAHTGLSLLVGGSFLLAWWLCTRHFVQKGRYRQILAQHAQDSLAVRLRYCGIAALLSVAAFAAFVSAVKAQSLLALH